MVEWGITWAPIGHGPSDRTTLSVSSPHRTSFRGRRALTDETYEALVIDWDGTVVPDRDADAQGARERVEALSDAGVHIFIVSGTHVENVDGQLQARPQGRGHLFLCCNRGSEVFQVTGKWAPAPGPADGQY